MYFIGVTTGQSSINRVFPLWAERLALGDCALRGMDFPLQAEPERFRTAVDFIKHDPLSLGALVTTHKLAVYQACRDQFDTIEPLSATLGEISSIYKRDGRLHGRSVDPWTSGYALKAFLPPGVWREGAEALILGAGGAGTALAWRLTQDRRDAGGPARIHAADRQQARLDHLQQLHAAWCADVSLECHYVPNPALADRVAGRLPAGSLVVNATGLGKDAPGSPLTDAAVFPEHGVVWEFNYRGKLVFLEQARAQQRARTLKVEDGWIYFLHGWTRVMADVFNREIPTEGLTFDELGRLAAGTR